MGFTATGVGGLGQSEGFDRPRLIAEGRDGPVRAALGWLACPERHARARTSAQSVIVRPMCLLWLWVLLPWHLPALVAPSCSSSYPKRLRD